MGLEKMVPEINGAISLIPLDKLRDFRRELVEVAYDENWLSNHHMPYANPDITRIKEIILKEQFEKYLIHRLC